jgi:hypothetical protein
VLWLIQCVSLLCVFEVCCRGALSASHSGISFDRQSVCVFACVLVDDTQSSATPSTFLIMSGRLNKKSPKAVFGMRSWQTRYFALYEDRIIYKKDEQSSDDAGM